MEDSAGNIRGTQGIQSQVDQPNIQNTTNLQSYFSKIANNFQNHFAQLTNHDRWQVRADQPGAADGHPDHGRQRAPPGEPANDTTAAGHVTQSSPLIGPQEISGLEKGIEYEFRVAGVNTVGPGQETIKYYLTPEG